MTNIPPVYDPQTVENKWYRFWEEKGLFHAQVTPGKPYFSIVIPPPNVTGQLHMGHALDNTLQDILVRWHRMQGDETLWMPGTDHAGIATQIKVEEQLAKEGLSRYDLGREKFIERVWDWKKQFGDRIINQLKRLGASCDWGRERFTMDEGCSRAVREVFVSLYEKGLIYRGNRITNWCPRCQTALSDIEVEHEEQPGRLYYVRYPVEGSDEYVTIATTRPETILGDTAVAVHPDDERYRRFVGHHLILPLVGRRLPVVADEYVDPSFGTGAVKVTPAHDPNDFDIGLRHNLPAIKVIENDGTMAAGTGKYTGMDRYACRRAIVDDLQQAGYLVRVEDHTHAVGHCQRCHTVVEPLISQQWFVRMQPLAEPALQAVRDGRITFVPERFTKIYINWLENIRDWCISRQIWWGHRIPAWYCQSCGQVIVSRTDVTSCPHCGAAVEQDPDVLDTWFSSALWPFSTMGWPEQTPELKYFYPTSVLVTGYDIIFFWVARMIFMAMEFQREIPFRHVFIHGLVRDAQGRKMSKSLGNGIDPLEVVEKYGADTLRFTLVTGNTPGNDMRFYWERVEGSRNFANKIWNAARFVLMNLDGFEHHAGPGELAPVDKWIISRYQRTVAAVTDNLARFELGEAARALYDFIWSEFCDWYIEMSKPRLYDRENAAARQTAQYVLWYVLLGTMKLLHPFMPFITEEIWQHLPHEGISIMTAPWPQVDNDRICPQAEQRVNLVMEIIKAVRNMRAEMNVPPGKRSPLILLAASQEMAAFLQHHQPYFTALAGAAPLTVDLLDSAKPKNALTAVAQGVEIYLPLKGLIDVNKELARLAKERDELAQDLARVQAKLANQAFIAKAPPVVVAKERAKEKELQAKRQALEERMAYLEKLR